MVEDPVRSFRQLEIARAWGKRGGRGTLEATTGFGKTLTAIKAAKLLREKYPKEWNGPDTLVVVPSIALRDKWAEDLKEAGYDRVVVAVVNSIVLKEIIRHFRLVILDEVHSYTSEVFGQIFQKVRFDHVLALTATMPPEDERRALIEKYAPVIATVGLKECMENGWVSEYSVFNLGIDLNAQEREDYNKIDSSFGTFFSKFGHDLELMYRCLKSDKECAMYATTMGYNPKLAAAAQLWTPHSVKIWAINANRMMNQRRDFLLNLPRKVEIAKMVCDRFPNSRIITFSNTTESCDKLTELIGKDSRSYHSKVTGGQVHGVRLGKEKMLNLILRQFASGEGGVRILNTAKALDQGIDIPFVDVLITLAASSKVRQALQRLGRAIRFMPGKHAKQIEIYARNTQEETWLRKRQKQIPKDHIIEVSSVEEIPV